MDVDVEVGIPVGILLIPIAIIAIMLGGRDFIKNILEDIGNVGREWEAKAQETHYKSVVEFEEQQIEQSGSISIVGEELAHTGVNLSQYGIYATSETGVKQVRGL